jgi:hypothetical protein
MFKSILCQYQGASATFVPNVPRWQHRDVDPFGEQQHSWEQLPCFLFSQTQLAHFQGALVEVLRPSRDNA